MSYVVLARKWRPMRFEDLVGQEHVSRTLANAIQSGRVAHAFLFTGVRGVGKTTSARILAKALCCLGDPASSVPGRDPGPTVSPCLKCAACLEIAQGNDVDVREIDGASYNGVDEVRKLQDSLPYRPARDRFKIVIVDEVHMLSQNAWNAFLKTLEEPPPHVKFIFATTEAHKVPVTILSRVQRFDFRLISAQAIAARLRFVLDQEGIHADDQALGILSREASGSMRDAMSLLDQVIAWGGSELKGDDVARVLGVASRSALQALASALVAGEAAICLDRVSGLANQGFDMAHVARDLLAWLRDLVVAKVCPDPERLLDLTEEEVRDVQALAGGASTDDLLRLHQGFSQGFDEVVRSGQTRAALEMLLVRLARRPPLVPLDEFVSRLSQLEQRLSAGKPEGAARPARAIEGAEPTRSAARPREARSAAPPRDSKSDEPGEPPPAPVAAGSNGSTPLAAPMPASARAPTLATVTTPPSAPAAVPAPLSAPAALAAPSSAPEADGLAAFRRILDRVHEQRPELAAVLSHAALLECAPDRLVVGFEPGSLFAGEAGAARTQELLKSAAAFELGPGARVMVELESKRAASTKSLSALDSETRETEQREALANLRKHPRIAEAVEILGARLKDLKLAQH